VLIFALNTTFALVSVEHCGLFVKVFHEEGLWTAFLYGTRRLSSIPVVRMVSFGYVLWESVHGFSLVNMAHSLRLGRLVGSKFVQRVCLWVLPSPSLPTCNSESEWYAGGDCNSRSPARASTPASAFQSHMRHSIL
jgi:hypothetical protein